MNFILEGKLFITETKRLCRITLSEKQQIFSEWIDGLPNFLRRFYRRPNNTIGCFMHDKPRN